MFFGKDESAYDAKNRPQEGVAGAPLRLNHRIGGGSGRRKFCLVDWDQDGRLDMLANSVNINFFRQLPESTDGKIIFQDKGPIHVRELAGHTTSPTPVNWDREGGADVLIGAEDGRLYLLRNPNANK